jgi:hypothetical protein
MTVDPNVVRQTLDEIAKAQKAAIPDPRMPEQLAKSTFSQSASATSGMTFYDLELGAKLIYPVLTPLRNMIPRVPGKGGIQAAWRAVTGVNTTNIRAGVSGGNRGGVIAVSTADYTAAYKGLGLEGNVDFEAQYAGRSFEDVKALGAARLLEATMIQEEYTILGGNNSVALGTTPTPTLVDAATGGALIFNTAYSVICVALALDAVINGSVVRGIDALITRTNADASSDQFGGGAAKKSAAQAVTTANDAVSTHKITASLSAPVNGAFGYAWFWGSAGSEVLGAITTNPTYVITANATGTQTALSLGTVDNSQNSLVFDGLLYQAVKTGSNAYVKAISNTLTADNAGGIVEIEVALQDRWDNYRLTPDTMWVNSQQALDVSKKILAGTASSAQRFVFQTMQDMLMAGVMVRTYLNRFSMQGGQTIDIKIHPNVPAGVILMTTGKLPYPISNVDNVFQIRERQSYYQIEWPLRTRKYEFGVYMDEVLQHYFPPSMIVLYDIKPG